MRVLVADREPRVRAALRLLLVQAGAAHEVYEAGSAEELMGQVESQRPALLIVDWDVLGPRHADQLSAARGAARDVRVIVISARAEHRQLAVQAGCDAFVSKTESPTRLREELQALACSRSGDIAAQTSAGGVKRQ